jgi:hypothetical protein
MTLFSGTAEDWRDRRRHAVLGGVLLMQTVFFCLFAWRPAPGMTSPGLAGSQIFRNAATPDYSRYELPAYNLASGRHLALPLRETNDPTVQGWVCSRHPEACFSDGTHPSALYPPGYSLFVAGIYKVVGRSVTAVIVIQYLLLLALFALFEALAARMLDGNGYLFAMAMAATYPFLAMYAVLFSTEHLHNVLLFAALAAMLMMEPGWRRGTVFGLTFAFATLVRPYSLVVFPVIWLWPSIWRAARASWRERLLVAVLFTLPLALWAGRNAYWFGRYIPMTTGGPGVLLMHTTLEWQYDPYAPNSADIYYGRLGEMAGGGDVSTHDGERHLRQIALGRIKENPGRFVMTVIKHIPKLWISLGSSEHGLSPYWPWLVLYLGGLWALGLVGGWYRRQDGRWHILLVTIATYWAFLLYTPGEARRTIALRLPMLLLAGAAVGEAVRVWQKHRGQVQRVVQSSEQG